MTAATMPAARNDNPQRAHQRAHAALAQALPHWPDTLEQAMRQPLAAALIRLASMGLHNGNWAPCSTHPPRGTDHKRAAAGDRDDD